LRYLLLRLLQVREPFEKVEHFQKAELLNIKLPVQRKERREGQANLTKVRRMNGRKVGPVLKE
jgi:hypothetical protein